MKQIVAFILAAMIYTGCIVSGEIASPNLSGSLNATSDRGDFIELFKGGVIEGTVSVVNNTHLKVNEKTYHVKEIKSYQKLGVYRTTFKNRFITHIVKGKINVYRRDIGTYFAGDRIAGSFDERPAFYLQKGDAAPIEYYDLKRLEQMVADNEKALEWVKKYKALKRKDDGYLDKAIETYNLN